MIPKGFGFSYFDSLVLAGAFVEVEVELEVPDSLLPLQPANTPSRPKSTIRVTSLFIVGVTFTKKAKLTSKILPQ